MVVITHLNARSLMADGRLSEIASLLSFNNIDILCLSETWLKPQHMNSTLSIPGYQPLIRRDRPAGRGGGVAMYLRDGLTFKVLPVVPTYIECMAVQVRLPRRKCVTVITCYRPPSAVVDNFLDSLDTVISSVQQSSLVVTGDFNAKHSSWFAHQATDSAGSALKDFMDGHDLLQLISSPTYNVCSAKPVLLDLIFIGRPLATSVVLSSVLPPVADHCAVIVHLSIRKAPVMKPYTKECWDYNNADVTSLLDHLVSCDWTDCSTALDLDRAVQSWQSKFLDVCAAAIPRRTYRVYPSSKPWFSTYLKYLARCRDRLFHRSRGKPDSSRVMTAYRKTRNLFVSELRAAEQRYFLNLGRKLHARSTDPHSWWQQAKSACGWSTPRSLPALSSGSSLLTEPYAKACILNDHFQQQCSAANPADFNHVCQLQPKPGVQFNFSNISPASVAKKLRGLPSWKSCGRDGVTNMLLKLTADQVSSQLANLFNRSLAEGLFPSGWKEAVVTPVPKDGKDLSLPSSYRPIALLSSLSKVLEHLVKEQLTDFCLEHNIFPDEQFGFLRGRSTEWQLLSVLEDWHVKLDGKSCVHAVFLDAAKAFDRVDHTILLSRLADIGVGDHALKWFWSYLTGRSISTRVDGVLSDSGCITSGVPQGSVLGPLLFLIYFKDIPAVVQAVSALFADDTLIYRGDCKGDRQTPCCGIQDDLHSLSRWASDSGVLFNVEKSAEFCVGTVPPASPPKLEETPLPRVRFKKHLGALLDNKLCWNSHLDLLQKRVAGPVNLCKRLIYRHHLPPDVIRRFYLAFIRPRLEYCSAVWGGASRSALLKLERMQLQVARALTTERNLHGGELLRRVNLPTLAWRRREHRLALMWQLYHGQGPPQLLSLFPQPVSARSTLSLRSPHSLRFPLSSSSRHLSSFLCLSVPEWNALPSDVVLGRSLPVFVSHLRRFFDFDRFSFGL